MLTRVGVVGACIVLLGTILGVVPDARAQTPYELALSSAVIESQETGEITLTVTPNGSGIAALGGVVTYDETLFTAASCEAFEPVGACNVAVAGEVGFQILNPNGWTEPTDLVTIQFTNNALAAGDEALGITVTRAVDTERVELPATLVVGEITTFENGDVDCSGSVNIVDALLIAQFVVGTRTDSATCPLADPAGQAFAENIDVNCDGQSTIVDALFIAQYAVTTRTATTTCPLANPAGEIYLGA